MGASSLSRFVVLPVTALAGALTTYVVIDYAGVSQFAYIALAGTLFQLIPFADLGLGAAIVNAVAGEKRDGDATTLVARTVRAAFLALAMSGAAVVVLSAAVSGLNLWGPILGLPVALQTVANWAVFLALVPFAISLPLGIGQRVLLGLGKNHYVNLIGGIGPVVAVLTTLLLVKLGAEPMFLAIATPVGVLVVAAACFIVALRQPGWRPPSSSEPIAALRVEPVRLWSAAAPMLIISVAVPLAMQSGRLVLSHVGTPVDLAEYSVGFQFYAPSLSLAVTAAVTLWPVFARNRAQSGSLWRRVLGLMTAAGLMLGLGFALLINPVASVVTNGAVSVSPPTAIAFGVLLFVMSAHQPSAVLLTTPRLLAFQAACCVVMLAIAVGLAFVLGPIFGASGIVVGAIIGVALGQLVPGIWRSAKLVGAK